MKKIGIVISCVLLCTTMNSLHAQNTAKALQYMEKINKEFKNIMTDSWDYMSASAHGKKARAIENRRKELVRTVNSAKNRVASMQALDGKTEYRDSVVSFLSLNYLVLNGDYDKIVNMEDIAEQSYDNMEAYLLAKQKANDKLDSASERLDKSQEKFAAENNINLVSNPDKTVKKLEKAGEVNSYYNKLFLIFFKAQKQEVYMIDALNKNDVNAFEQNKTALLATTEECIVKLKDIKPYKGNQTVKKSCGEALKFYNEEAKKDAEVISDYLVKKESFDKIKKAYETKGSKSKSKDEIDAYNKSVNEFNAANNKYNDINNSLNKKRADVLNDWNNTVNNFIDKYTPKYK
jgi:K+/H+ antiporter YhaU regulatory subunit KhtT